MSMRRPAAALSVRGRPSAELPPPATDPDSGRVRRRPTGPGVSTAAAAAPPVDSRSRTVPADGSPSSRASSGVSRKRRRDAVPDVLFSSSVPPSELSREALEYELACARGRLAGPGPGASFVPSAHTSFGNVTVLDADGRPQGPQDIHEARAPRAWCLSRSLAQGSAPADDWICSGNYVELELLGARGGVPACALVELGLGPLPSTGRRSADRADSAFSGSHLSASSGQIFPCSFLTASTGQALDFCERFFSGASPGCVHFCAGDPAACRSVRAGSALLHVGRFRRRDLPDMTDGFLRAWRDRRGAVDSAIRDAFETTQQGADRLSASSQSNVPRPNVFDELPDGPRRETGVREIGELGKRWMSGGADDDPFITTPAEEVDDAASRPRGEAPVSGQRLGSLIDEESDRRLARGNSWERPRSSSVFTYLATVAGASVVAATREDPSPERDVMAEPRGRGRRRGRNRSRSRSASPDGRDFREGSRAWEENPFRSLAGVRPGALLEDFLATCARQLGSRPDLGIRQSRLGSIGGADMVANSYYQLVHRSLRL